MTSSTLKACLSDKGRQLGDRLRGLAGDRPAEADADVVVDRPPGLLEDEVLEELPPLLPFQEDQDPVMCRTPTLEAEQ